MAENEAKDGLTDAAMVADAAKLEFPSHHALTLPRSFDPSEFLTPRLTLHSDSARYLISTILRKTLRARTIFDGETACL